MPASSKGNFQKIHRVVARRVITEADSPDREVTLTIGMPRSIERDQWQCSILIEGLQDSPIADSATGIDSLQALLLAVESVRSHLKESGRRFAWLGESELFDTGIPRQVPVGFGRKFEERIERAIVRETRIAREFRAAILKRLFADAQKETRHCDKTTGGSVFSPKEGKGTRRKR